MAQQLDQVDVAQAIEQALEFNEEGISLLDLTKKAVPNLSEETIKKFIVFLVNGKKVDDVNTIVNQGDNVKVVPCFAGGF